MFGSLVYRVAVTVKCAFAITGITPDPAEDHLVANGAVQDVVWEGVGDIGLKFYSGAGRKSVSSLPAREIGWKGEPAARGDYHD